jgi:signal transduction histidine kinase
VEAERELFLILQEALANVVRHSGSNTAVVRMEKKDREIMLQVQDFGNGMPSTTGSENDRLETTGVGIPSMRERLRRIAGRLDIQSGEQGTVISAFVPVLSNNSPD